MRPVQAHHHSGRISSRYDMSVSVGRRARAGGEKLHISCKHERGGGRAAVFALINGATTPTRNSGFRRGGARGRHTSRCYCITPTLRATT